jgi:rhodanese-related sulfurtransferase
MSRTISAEELKTRPDAGDVIVIDVRREADYNADARAIPSAV